jgi:acyl-CoA synthetase (AMP-forming)/AMP-acid ligase II
MSLVSFACIVPTPGRVPTQRDVIALFEDRLASYKHPRDVSFLDELPRNTTGKIDFTRLRQLAMEQWSVIPSARLPQSS